MNTGNRIEINLAQSINTDTIQETISTFGTDATHIENTGIERNGGITNIFEKEVELGDGNFIYTDESAIISTTTDGPDTLNVSIDSSILGQVSEYGLEKKEEILGSWDDVVLTSEGTYLTCKLIGTKLQIREVLDDVVLHEREIDFINIGTVSQFITSLSFIRYDGLKYSDSLEFGLRIGEQLTILKESDPTIVVEKYLQSSSVLGTSAITKLIVYNNMLIVAGYDGRVGSYDGVNWKNYDGSGLGLGPYNSATAIGTGYITALVVYKGALVFGSSDGKLCSYDGSSWRNFDGTGSGSGPFNNATLVGPNAIGALGVWRDILAVGSSAFGYVGSTDGTTYWPYTTAVTAPLTGKTHIPLVASGIIAAVLAMTTIIDNTGKEILILAHPGGLISSWDYGWLAGAGTYTPTAAAATSQFTFRTTPAHEGRWNSIAYGDGIWITIANTTSGINSIIRSVDGINWNSVTTMTPGGGGPGHGWKEVAYGDGVWFATSKTASTTASMARSTDGGLTWSFINTTVLGGNLGAIAYGDGVWITISYTNSIARSVDGGLTWTLITTTTPGGYWESIAYGEGIWVAVTFSASTTAGIARSTDGGLTWTFVTTTAPGGNWFSVAYGDGVWIAVAQTNSTTAGIARSVDGGLTWTFVTTTAPSIRWVQSIYGDGVWIAVADTSSTTAGIARSVDGGLTWTFITSPVIADAWISIAYGQNIFIAITNTFSSTTAGIATSTAYNVSKIYQAASTISSTDGLNNLLNYNDNAIVSTATTGRIASLNYNTSTNYLGQPNYPYKELWKQRISPNNSGSFSSIAFGAGVHVAVKQTTTTNAICTSADGGVTWTLSSLPLTPPGPFTRIVYTNGKFIAIMGVTSNGVFTSVDGYAWAFQALGFTPLGEIRDITWGNNMWVAVTNSTSTTESVFYSPDFITWTAAVIPVTPGAAWIRIAFGNGIFVALAETNTTNTAIYISPDGSSWSSRTYTTPSGLARDISFGGDKFVIAYNSNILNSLARSSDGITWTQITITAPAATWRSVVFGGGLWLATTNLLTPTAPIATSPDGITWTYRNTVNTPASFLYSAAYGNNNWVMVAAASTRNVFTLKFIPPNIANNATVVGATTVTSLTKYGNQILVSGLNKVGSYDGSSWKNSDGTGTGTGNYTESIVGTGTISSTAGLQDTIVASSGSLVNSMNLSNLVSPSYKISGTPYASGLFFNMTTQGYCDVYRYENGLYSIGIVNNNLSRWYVLNNSTLDLTVNFGKYAWPQIKLGKTRHILTETPRISSGIVKVFSFQGYTDFVNFSATQVYPTENTNTTNTILLGQVGWNYGDVTYRTTASATGVLSLLGPTNNIISSNFYRTFSSNTNTLATAYGKLTNGIGNTPTKPFEIRMNWLTPGASNTGSQSYISVAQLDSGITDTIGTVITDVGAIDDTWTPHIVTDDTILYKYNNIWNKIKIGKNIPNRLQRIAPRIYKINTISPLNIVDTFNTSLEPGSLDYNGRMVFNSANNPSITNTKVASVITGKYSNSIDAGAKLVSISNISANNIDIIGYRIPSTSKILSNYFVDTYFDDKYGFSTYNDGSELINPDPSSPIYVSDTRLPVPIGSKYDFGIVLNNRLTIFLDENYDGYQIGNDTSGTYTPFTLFGQPYLFDGIDIYTAIKSGNILVGQDKLCNATGMIIVAVSPVEALFLSDFDNSLYSFSGGRNLTKAKRLTNEERIISGIWSTKDNAALLNTENTFIWLRDNIATKNLKKTTQLGDINLYNTSDGIIIQNDSVTDVKSWKYSYTQDGTVVPLKFRSAYFGQNSNQKSMLSSFVVTIYSKEKEQMVVKLGVNTIDESNYYSQSENITINKNMYSDKGLVRIRIQPKYQLQLGSSLSVETDKHITILEAVGIFTDNVNAIPSATKSR